MTTQPGFFSDPIGHLREGAERNAAMAGKDRYGNQNDPGWWNNMIGNLTGATDAGTQEYVQAEKDFANEQKYKAQVEALGGTYTGGTEGDILRQIDRLKVDRTNSDYENSPAGKAAAAQLALQTTQLQQQGKRLDNQMEMAYLDRADAKEQRAAELEFKKMQARKDDLRYNERMEQLDRKDRKMAISSIAAGLASLGAAFAI